MTNPTQDLQTLSDAEVDVVNGGPGFLPVVDYDGLGKPDLPDFIWT